jgi:hypothetical protein
MKRGFIANRHRSCTKDSLVVLRQKTDEKNQRHERSGRTYKEKRSEHAIDKLFLKTCRIADVNGDHLV